MYHFSKINIKYKQLQCGTQKRNISLKAVNVSLFSLLPSVSLSLSPLVTLISALLAFLILQVLLLHLLSYLPSLSFFPFL